MGNGFWEVESRVPVPGPLSSHQAAPPGSASWAPFLVLLVDQFLLANSFFICVICIIKALTTLLYPDDSLGSLFVFKTTSIPATGGESAV